MAGVDIILHPPPGLLLPTGDGLLNRGALVAEQSYLDIRLLDLLPPPNRSEAVNRRADTAKGRLPTPPLNRSEAVHRRADTAKGRLTTGPPSTLGGNSYSTNVLGGLAFFL